MSRAKVAKTYKLYIGGAFVRSESGRAESRHDSRGGFLGNVCIASRKDLRDAVKAARGAFDGWRARTPYNRAQILYRTAEMLEARSSEFCDLIVSEAGVTAQQALKEVECAIDRCVYYCGWADKFASVFGSVNPVSGPYFDFSVPEPTGVVGVNTDGNTPLVGLVSQVMPVIVSGNTCVVLAPDRFPVVASEIAEVLATSDLPGGVANVLTGSQEELLPHMARHMDVNAIDYRGGDEKVESELLDLGAENLKRVRISERRSRQQWVGEKAQGPEWIEDFVETKTVWHPIGV